MKTPCLSCILVLAVPIPALAQAVVPARFQTVDGPSLGWFPGAPRALRQQIILGAPHLRALRGKTLVGLWVRRDTSLPEAFRGGAIDASIDLSSSPRLDPNAPSPRFDANHGPDRTRVMKARVVVPNSPAVQTPHDPWSVTNTVRIAFTTTFRYGGGALVLDWVGVPVQGREIRNWPLDYELERTAGAVTEFGTSCTRVRFVGPHTASAWPRSLVIGGTAIFPVVGRPGSDGFFLVGTRLYPRGGLPLAPLGAPGCTLHVDPQATLPVLFGPPLEPGMPSHAVARVQLPADAGLLGGSFFGQWVLAEWRLPPATWTNRAGMTTSNAISVTLAARPATLGLATVTRSVLAPPALPAKGTVRVGTAPVLRLLAR